MSKKLIPYVFQPCVNDKYNFKQIMFTKILNSTKKKKKLNAKQNSIEVALIPHVRYIQHIA
jgi:hypothetical protein